MKIGIYAGHFGIAGGGENHSLGFINILKDYYDVTVMLDPWNKHWISEVEKFFGYDMSKIKFEDLDHNLIPTFDQFININHGRLLPPLARRNILLCFYPQYQWNTAGYDTILTNSQFTKRAIQERWRRNEDDIHVIYPPVDIDAFKYSEKKQRMIMTIGRYFQVPDGNNKNHLVMIDAFKKIPDPTLKFNIVGSIQNQEYYETVKEAASSDPRIKLFHDLDQASLIRMYSDAMIYWHAAGYGTELTSSMEHFGMPSVESMAAGAIPIVHNSGGMPESGAITWDEPEDLISKTLYYLKNKEDRIKTTQRFRKRVESAFSLKMTTKLLLQAIEKPVAVFRPEENSSFQKPPVRINVNPQEIKVGMIGDAPNLTTGFGIVEKMFGRGFRNAGFEVTQVGLQDINEEPRMDDEWRVWRPGYQAVSPELLDRWIKKDQPNVLWLNYDAGNIADWLNKLAAIKCPIPVIAYFPIEGFPVPASFIDMAKLIARPVTYLEWGSEMIYNSSGFRIDHVPHGLDHAKFERFDEARRQKLKDDIGWGDKFVIGSFGRNKRTKQQPRLIETIRMLKEEGIKDVVLYLHCQPFEGNMMQGWALQDIVKYNEVEDYVCFPPNNGFTQVWGIDYEKPTEIPEHIINDLANDPDRERKERAIILSSYSMIERYNMCDLFVTVSQAEGFNLPLGEAMACGVPVISVDDAGSQKEVACGAAHFIKPIEWDTWHIGTLLPIVSKKTLMNDIALLMSDPNRRRAMSDASLEKASQYTWNKACEKMNNIVKDTYIKARV